MLERSGYDEPLAMDARTIAVFTLIYWSGVVGIYTVAFIASEAPWRLFPVRMVNQIIGILLCGGLYGVLRMTRRRSLTAQMLSGGAASLVAGLLYAASVPLLLDLMLGDAKPPLDLSFGSITSIGANFFGVFFGWCVAVLALTYGHAVQVSERRRQEAQKLAAEAQQRMLRYQLNPHFLFNALNAVSHLVLARRNDQAEAALMGLSAFLRRTLSASPLDFSPVDEEFDALREFFSIARIRFGDRLSMMTEIQPGAGDALVPSLILQPLVENAVKFATDEGGHPMRVELIARCEGETLVLEIHDDGRGDAASEEGLGLGLRNVRQRLAAAYGQAANLSVDRMEGHGYRAVIRLPLERAA